MAFKGFIGILFVLVSVTRCVDGLDEYGIGYMESENDDDSEEKYRIGVISDRVTWLFDLRATLEVAMMAAREHRTEYELSGIVASLSQQDALEAGQKACKLMGRANITGLVAPFNSDSLWHVQAAADLLDVPLLITQPLDVDIRTWTAINLYPHYSAISEVVMAMIVQKGWTRFTVVFEEPEAVERLSTILKENSKATPYYITTRQLPQGENYRSLLLNLKGSNSENLIVDCKLESALRLLEQAQEVGIVSEPYSYIFTHLDLQTLDLERYSYGGANITAFRMFDVSSPMVINFTRSLNETYYEYFKRAGIEPPEGHEDCTPESLPSVLPLTYDAVQLQAVALKDLKVLKSLNRLDCDNREGLEFGSTIINHMRTLIIEGLTGTIKFDKDGDRSEMFLEVLELIEGGVLTKVGNWSSIGINIKDRSGGEPELIIEHPPEDIPPDDSDSMKDKHFIILISLTDPYGMRRESTKKLQGNERFEGFCVELIEELAKILGFKYTFEIQEDGQYGNFNETTNQWNGMLGRVINGTADFAITDLTITAEREAAVDFTTPFMNLGISILFGKPEDPGANPFSFLLPFSKGVWFGLGAAYLGCSVLLYILGRLCPEEWQNPFPCVEEPTALENQFTFANALWFNLGAVLLQGSEIAPVAYGTRAAASMWWFFALIITSSYTANLASLLSITQKFEPIHEAADLVNNPYNITYGAKELGSTYAFFKDSGDPVFHQMYEYMLKNPWHMAKTNENATARVLQGNYAFLMESTSIEYLVERQCGLMQVGKLLDNKGYGLAMKKMSVYRQKLNLALLNLLEQGKLAGIKKKWWKEKRGGGVCVEEKEPSMELALMNVGGVFLVLVVGCFLGVLVSFLDMTWHVFRRARMLQVPFIPEFKREIKFVFNFNLNEKPLRHQRSDSSSGSQRALTLQSLRTTPARDSFFSLTPEESSLGTRTPERRQSGHASGRRASGRSARRRSTMHEGSVRLARQSTKE